MEPWIGTPEGRVMGRRRGISKFAPTPETPQPQAQAGTTGTQADLAAAPVKKEGFFESERRLLFGPVEKQKGVLILMIVGLVVAGLGYVLSPSAKPGDALRFGPMAFVLIHGALIGMLMGQLVLAYPDGMIVLFTLMSIVIAESIYGAWKWQNFVFCRERLQEILGLFFWPGFAGFWFAFWMYFRRGQARKRFVQRHVGSGPIEI
jgi:hypothetical protein